MTCVSNTPSLFPSTNGSTLQGADTLSDFKWAAIRHKFDAEIIYSKGSQFALAYPVMLDDS